MGFFSKISEGLKKTRESLKERFDDVFSGGSVDEDLFEELEEALVLADTGANTASAICEELRKKVKKEGVSDPEKVREMMYEVVAEMLRGGQELDIENKPAIIMMIGVNGAGKTTTIGKLAKNFMDEGKKVVVAAADTFRAAAIDQLEVWTDRCGAELIKHSEGSDPAAVVFDAIAAGKARKADVIICDTAGRLHNKKNLMEELAKIYRVIDRQLPYADREVLLVLDATTGQNAVNQAKEFKNAAGITGIILTKLDGTAKGGVVLSITDELGIPVKLIGVGEQVDDLQTFAPADFAAALFGEE